MFPIITVPKLHTEYNSWMAELSFCTEEICLFQHYLQNHNNGDYSSLEARNFQKLFSKKQEEIDTLLLLLRSNERQLAGFVKAVSGMGLDSIKIDTHSEIRNDMKNFRKTYKELKENYRLFESGVFVGN